MKTIRTKIGKGGRIIIPTAFRKNLHLQQGDEVILHMENNAIYITTSEQALLKLQMKVKSYTKAREGDNSLTDTLIVSYQKEVKDE